jgi:hypothetical protein
MDQWLGAVIGSDPDDQPAANPVAPAARRNTALALIAPPGNAEGQRTQGGNGRPVVEDGPGPPHLRRQPDLTGLKAADKLSGGEVDDFDGIRLVQKPIRHQQPFAIARQFGDLTDRAFEMLKVQGAEDIDARGEQHFDVVVAATVAPATDAGSVQVVDQHELRTPGQDRSDIEFAIKSPLLLNDAQGDGIELERERTRFGPPVAVDQPNHHVDAGVALD